MKASTRITGGMAIAVVLLTGAWARGQSKKDTKNSGNPPAAATANTASPVGASSVSGQKGKSGGGMQSAQSNPMYKENKNDGTNPLFESHDSVDKGPAGTSATVPEDARYRPGNNKTTKALAAGVNKNHETVEYKDPEDTATRPKTPAGKTQNPN